MKSRLVSLQHIVKRVVLKNRELQKRESSNFDCRPGFRHPHMNEMPVPHGPWDPWYAKKQALYLKFLAAGILSFLAALVAIIYTESYHLNWGPPPQPGPPSDMVEECEDIDKLPF